MYQREEEALIPQEKMLLWEGDVQPKQWLYEGECIDDTGFGGYRLIQKRREFCYGIDAVLLADFAALAVRPNANVCDLGTGTGIIPLILAHKTKAAQIVGVELQRDSWSRACRMAALNGLQERLHFFCADVATLLKTQKDGGPNPEDLLRPGGFQTVTANPPYVARGAGLQNDNDARRIARHETTAGIAEFAAAAARLLAEGGQFCLVHRPSRLADIITACREVQLEPKELRFVSPMRGQVANLFLLRCRKGGGPELSLRPTLVVYGEDGTYNTEILRIYKREKV